MNNQSLPDYQNFFFLCFLGILIIAAGYCTEVIKVVRTEALYGVSEETVLMFLFVLLLIH